MRLSSGDYPDDPFVTPHSRIHCEESFLNDIVLNLLGLTIICLLLYYIFFVTTLKLVSVFESM